MDKVTTDQISKRQVSEYYSKKEYPPKCPHCKVELQGYFENNGFDEPSGPSKWEIIYLFCPLCGHKE